MAKGRSRSKDDVGEVLVSVSVEGDGGVSVSVLGGTFDRNLQGLSCVGSPSFPDDGKVVFSTCLMYVEGSLCWCQ